MHPLRIALALAAPLALAACGGGGGGDPAASALPNADRVRELTGSLPPAESVAAQAARVDGITGRADSLIVSSLHGDTTFPGETAFVIQSTCRATECILHAPGSGLSWTLGLEDFQQVSSTREGIRLTRNGITLGEVGADGFESYGAWMHHAAFGVHSERETVMVEGRSYRVYTRYAIAGGDLTGSEPTALSAAWRGVMVGTPATGSTAGHVLQGDAALTYSFEGGRGVIDAAFTGIKDLDRLAPHVTEAVRIADVPVHGDGTFGTGPAGNRIQGGFYGPDHAEAAGVFEHSNIVGAFGAKRR